MNDLRTAAERLSPDELPRLALFLADAVRDAAAGGAVSAQRAAWQYAAEAELDELQELADEWQVLRAAARELPLAEVNRLLRERFASDWAALSRDEIDAVGAELERALAE